MAPVTSSIEVARTPEDVWAYLDQVERHVEWQGELLESRLETPPPVRVGSIGVERRRVPGGVRQFRYEITEHDPPRRMAFRVLNGPVRPAGAMSVAPTAGGGSRVSFDIEFHGHGLGKLLAPLASRDATKRIPEHMRRLKERLEAEPAAAPAAPAGSGASAAPAPPAEEA